MTVFFDTNILIYAQQQGDKGDRARALLAAGGLMSVQVLNEFANVSRSKLGKSWAEVADALEDARALIDPPLPLTLALHELALGLARDHTLSFYDALIVAAALEAGCDRLYSEDLQHGRAFGGLTVINPFI